jgi:hypothetical protein
MFQALKVGDTVGGRFTIAGILGEGGMGTVYHARHVTLPCDFAIKVLKRELQSDPAMVERFRREAVAASLAQHPNVVHIGDFGALEDGSPYLVMERLVGTGLDEVMENVGALPLSRALPILIQLADALDCCHDAGVVHRDLKPENVLLCSVRGRADVVKLVDFGISKIVGGERQGRRITLSGQIFGTPEYIAPEQAMDGKIDGRTDLYSFGILAYELVTGEAPFTGEVRDVLRRHVHELPPAPSTRMPRQVVPSGFDGVLLKCLAKDPADRFATGRVVCRELQKLRGQMAGMAENLLAGGAAPRSTGPARISTRGAWSPIAPTRELSTPVLEADLLEERAQPALGPVTGTQAAVDLAASSSDLREQHQRSLKEVALSLSEAGYRSDELSTALARLLTVEEESKVLVGRIAVLEQNFERIRFETGEQETMLKFALLDLNLQKDQALARGAVRGAASVEDLAYQIEALAARLTAVLAERTTKIQGLNAEIQEFRRARAARDEEAARLYIEVHVIVEGVRDSVTSPQIQVLFAKVDAISQMLHLARESVRFMRPPGT